MASAKGGIFTLQRLQARHHAMIDLLIEGRTKTEVCDTIGMSRDAASMIFRTPLFQEELTRRRETRTKNNEELNSIKNLKTHDFLESKSLDAAATLGDLLSSNDDRMRLASANSILDRTYGKKADDRATTVVQINSSQLKNLQIAFLESQGKEDEAANLKRDVESLAETSSIEAA